MLATVRRDGIEARGEDVVGRGGGGVQGSRSSSSTRRQGSPYYSTARLWDDGIIDPLDTRRVLGLALRGRAERPDRRARYGVFRM